MQCWALSSIPSDPGIFPSQNLYTNMDYLLSRTHPGRNTEEATQVFPSLIWYIFMNEKLFNARDFSPMDTTKLASRECSAWLIAN